MGFSFLHNLDFCLTPMCISFKQNKYPCQIAPIIKVKDLFSNISLPMLFLSFVYLKNCILKRFL